MLDTQAKAPSPLIQNIARGFAVEWRRATHEQLVHMLVSRWDELIEGIRLRIQVMSRHRKNIEKKSVAFGSICEYMGQGTMLNALEHRYILRSANVWTDSQGGVCPVNNGHWEFTTPYNINFNFGDPVCRYYTQGEADMAIVNEHDDQLGIIDFGWPQKLKEKARRDETNFPKIQAMMEDTLRSFEKLHVIFHFAPQETGRCDRLKTGDGRCVDDCYVTYVQYPAIALDISRAAMDVLSGTKRLDDFQDKVGNARITSSIR